MTGVSGKGDLLIERVELVELTELTELLGLWLDLTDAVGKGDLVIDLTEPALVGGAGVKGGAGMPSNGTRDTTVPV